MAGLIRTWAAIACEISRHHFTEDFYNATISEFEVKL